MRRLKLQTQLSLDGYMAGPNGEMDCISSAWFSDTGESIAGIWKSVDTIVLGHNLAEGYISAWES